MDNFVHLHGHSDYSALDGAGSIKAIVERVQHLGQPAVALTEHGNVDSAFKFSLACQEAGIKPIHGCEMYFAPNGRHEKNESNPIMHLILLAKNQQGWENILQLICKAHTEGFYYKPRIDFELLEEHHEGLIVLTSCLQGPLAYHLRKGDEAKAIELSAKLQTIFGEDYYIEIMNHGIPDQGFVVPALYSLAARTGIKTVATNDYHYITQKDWETQEILVCENMKKSYYDRVDRRMPQEFYLKSREEMEQFIGNSDSLDATLEIAAKCTLTLKKSKYNLPAVDEKTFDALVAAKEAEHLDLMIQEKYATRLKEEIAVVKEAGLMWYFLTVYDFVTYAKNNGVAVGPGRGSAGGSLLSYILGITAIDPIKYNLMFSRFYNAGRKESLPDIDIDFSSRNIGKMFEYIKQKYGEYNVCQIGTVNTYAPKASIKAICRVFQVPFMEANALSDLIDPKAKSLKAELEENEKVKEKYYNDSTPYSRHMTFKDIYSYAMRIEKLVAHKGVHAAGIIISPTDLRTKIPLRKDKNAELLVSCWAMDDLESNGLVKFDFLRIDNLDAIYDTLAEVGKTIEDILVDVDDPKVKKAYKSLTKTNNVGIFQLSSPDGSRIINRLKPVCMEDIAVGITLNRPGCINSGLHEKYINRKNNEEPIDYPHDTLIDILEDTFGVMIYQEQIIRICMKMAGFSESEADIVRKAMGKKKDKLMQSMKEKFITGSMKNGYTQKEADGLWALITEFSEYSFNKAHAVGYAYISYYCAYLKVNHATKYMVSLLNTAFTDQDKLKTYLNEARRIKVTVKPPSVNKSGMRFTGSKKEIIYGLLGVKGLGDEIVQNIIDHRPYTDLADFVAKTGVGQGILTLLAHAGALDEFGYTRKAIVHNAGHLAKRVKLYETKKTIKQAKLFDIKPDFSITDMEEYPIDELLGYEYDALQTFVSQDPLERYYKWIDENITDRDWDGESKCVAGYIQTMEEKVSKKGHTYLDVILYTPTSTQRILFFKASFDTAKVMFEKNRAVWVKGITKEDVMLADSMGILTSEEDYD